VGLLRPRLFPFGKLSKLKSVAQSAFFPVVFCVNPPSAFQHQGQSGTAGHGLVWHCPALLMIVQKAASEFLFLLSFTVLGKFSPVYTS
jgi:hypothetical protein